MGLTQGGKLLRKELSRLLLPYPCPYIHGALWAQSAGQLCEIIEKPPHSGRVPAALKGAAEALQALRSLLPGVPSGCCVQSSEGRPKGRDVVAYGLLLGSGAGGLKVERLNIRH